MAGLNLLPWREEARKESQKQFFMMAVAGVVVSSLVVLGVYSFYQDQITKQTTRNQYVQSEIKNLIRLLLRLRSLMLLVRRY